MNVFIIILSFIFLAIEAFMVAYVGKKMIKVKKLSLKDTILYPLIVILAAITLMIAKGYYLNTNAVDNISSSLKDSVSIVALGLNTEVVKRLWELKLFDSQILVVVYCVEYFISILALISISLSIILVTINNKARRLFYKFCGYNEIDYIVGFNDDAKKYVKNYYNEFINDKKKRHHKTYVILENSGVDKHENEKFYLNKYKMPYLEASYNDKKTIEKLLNKFVKKSKNRKKKFIIFIEEDKLLFEFVKLAINKINENVEFVVLANLEQENFLNNLLITSKEDRKEEKDCGIKDISNGKIRIINKYDLIALEFVQNHNFAKYFEPSLLNDDLTIKDCDINLFVLGFGKVNQAVLRDTLICNQFVQKTSDNGQYILSPKRMNVVVFEKNDKVDCFELNNGLFKYNKDKYNKNNYLDLPEDYISNIKIKSDFSIYSEMFINDLFKYINDRCKSNNQMNYFLISIDSDFANSDIALRLRDNLNHIMVTTEDNKVNKAYNRFFIRNKEEGYDEKGMIYTYGRDVDVLKYDNVVGTAIIDLAKDYEAAYQKLAGYEPSWDSLTPFKRKSNVYSVLSLYYKMSLLALKTKEIKIENIYDVLKNNYINNSNDEIVELKTVKDENELFNIRDVFAFIEHEKWNAYELSQGALPLSKKFVLDLTKENKDNKVVKNTTDELYHFAITTNKGLIEYYEFISDLVKKGYKGDPNVIKYDYYHMDLIKDDLEKNKTFNAIYERLIEFLNNQN